MAYLADEVGLGKTYVALATAALLPPLRSSVQGVRRRTQHSNIQRKWNNDWRAFPGHNWKVGDLRVKASGALGRPAVLPDRLSDLAFESMVDDDRDVFARLTSFSFATHGEHRDHVVSN